MAAHSRRATDGLAGCRRYAGVACPWVMMMVMVMTAVAPRRGDLFLVVVFGSGFCCETHDDCRVRYVPCDNNDVDQFR